MVYIRENDENHLAYPVTGHARPEYATVVVLDRDGKLVANIQVDDTPDHLTVAPDGTVYLVSVYSSAGDKTQTGSVT
ncbi:TPA: hypothetical protein ACJG4C_004707 [Salmonella enterica subsp. diarizonae serovar 61:r:z53]